MPTDHISAQCHPLIVLVSVAVGPTSLRPTFPFTPPSLMSEKVTLADALSNRVYSAFDPQKRIYVDVQRLGDLLLLHMIRVAEDLCVGVKDDSHAGRHSCGYYDQEDAA